MKKIIYLVILLFGVNLLICTAQGDRTIEPIQKWIGENVDNKRLKLPKNSFSSYGISRGIIENETDWINLWQAWRDDEVPKIDFTKNLIVFCTTTTPNSCRITLKLSPSGELKYTGLSTLIGSEDKTFNYQIVLVDLAGIKSIEKPVTRRKRKRI